MEWARERESRTSQDAYVRIEKLGVKKQGNDQRASHLQTPQSPKGTLCVHEACVQRLLLNVQHTSLYITLARAQCIIIIVA